MYKVDKEEIHDDRLIDPYSPLVPNKMDSEELFDLYYSFWFNTTAFFERSSSYKRYFDGVQWTKEELELLKLRQQPDTTYNIIKSRVQALVGNEIVGRTKTKALPREPEDTDIARIATEMLKAEDDIDDTDYFLTQAFEDCLITGLGCLLVEYDELTKRRTVDYVEWYDLLYDYNSIQPDLSDSYFKGIAKHMNTADIIEMFPHLDVEDIKKIAERIGNIWSDKESKRHYYSNSEITDRYIVIMWYVKRPDGIYKYVSLGDTCIYKEKLKLSQIPIVTIVPYKDSYNYPYGIVRDLISPQDMINKASSKMLSLMVGNTIIAEEGSITDVKRLELNIGKSNSILDCFETNSISEGRVIFDANDQKIQQASVILNNAVNFSEQISSVNGEFAGAGSNARAASAINQRIEQGRVQHYKYFDAFRLAKKKLAEISIEIFSIHYKEPRIVRIIGSDNTTEFLKVNQEVEENGEKKIENNLEKLNRLDIVLVEYEKSSNFNQEKLKSLAEISKINPALAQNPSFIAMFINAMDIKDGDKVIQSITQQGQ